MHGFDTELCLRCQIVAQWPPRKARSRGGWCRKCIEHVKSTGRRRRRGGSVAT